MIRLEGIGRSGDRGHHPPPPPPPPALSSSFSTLSPLAPPFTVDRWVPAVANPNSLPPPPPPPPPPPTGAMSPYFVPTGASRLTNFNSGLAAAEATPCYPYYDPVRDSVDDTFEQTSNYKGYVGGWSGTFDLEEGRPARGSAMNSSWMDCMASCQMSSALKKRGTADNFSAYDNSLGSWLGAHNESSFTHGHVGSECSEWLDGRHREIYVDKSRVPNDSCFPAELDTTLWPNDGSSYFYSPETTSVVKECDAFIRSPYERYVRQLISCSGDPKGHYPAQTTSRQAYAPSNEKNESVLSCVLKHGNSVIKHADLHRKNDDYVDYAIGMQNEASILENAEGNEGFVKMGIFSDATQRNGGTPDCSLQIKCLPSGNSSALGQSIDSLQDVKFGFKVGNLSCCNATNSERGIFMPDDSMRTTEEIPDHLNVAVDSPCWKGASMSRWYPFSPDEILQPLVNTLTSDNDELVQVSRSLKIQSDIDGTFVCNGNGKNIDLSPVTDLAGSDLKFQDCAERESNHARVESGMEIKQHGIHGERNNVLNEQVSVPQGIDDHVRQVSQVESNIWNAGSNTSETIPAVQNSDFVFNHISTSPNSSASSDPNASNGEMNLSSLNAIFPAEPKNPVSSDAPSKCLSQGQDTRVLVKAMLSLSDVLLCHYRNDDEALEECDLKPMQQIIDNLEAVILLNKKGITGSSSHLPRVEGTQPEVEVSNAKVSSDKVLTDAKENENALSTGLKNDKHDDIVKSFSTSFKVSDEVAQEEDPKILLYKNLWVQTEATLCSLKHDIALMKLEMGSFKNLFKAKSLVSSDGLAEPVKEHYDLNCATSISAGSPSRSNSKFEKYHRQSISKDEEVDTSVFARYRILKGRDEVAFSGLVEPQELNAIKSSVDREKGEMKELAPNLADKNATEKKGALQSHYPSKFVVASPKNLKGEKLPALDHGMGSGLLLNNTESAGVQESHLSASGGSVIQSYNPKSHGKRLFSSGSGSPSSEWEHVLKDEFTW